MISAPEPAFFGEAVLEYCSTRCPGTDNIRFSIVNGFLVVGDVVVGPLTLIPGEAMHAEIVPAVGKIVILLNHNPVDYKSPLGQQLRRVIAEKLVFLHQKLVLIDSAEELLSDRDEVVIFVHQPPAAPRGNANAATEQSSESSPSDTGNDESSDTATASDANNTRKRKKIPRKKGSRTNDPKKVTQNVRKNSPLPPAKRRKRVNEAADSSTSDAFRTDDQELLDNDPSNKGHLASPPVFPIVVRNVEAASGSNASPSMDQDVFVSPLT